MASRRLRLVNLVSRLVLRPGLAQTPTPAEARAGFDFVGRYFMRPPPFCLALRDGDIDWISVGQPAPRRVLLYFHGGAYIAGSSASYRAFAGHLSALSGLRIALADYPLAPEHPAPAAFDAAVVAYRRLLDLGYAPEGIVLGGDSAGGGLALALLARLSQEGLAPAGLFAFSPWTDLTASGASVSANYSVDRLLDPQRLGELVAHVTGGGAFPADDPRLSPLFAEFRDPPPVLMAVSGTEILLDDVRRMAERLREAGGTVTLIEEPDAPHVWPLFDGFAPEARRTLTETAEFARSVLRLPPQS